MKGEAVLLGEVATAAQFVGWIDDKGSIGMKVSVFVKYGLIQMSSLVHRPGDNRFAAGSQRFDLTLRNGHAVRAQVADGPLATLVPVCRGGS